MPKVKKKSRCKLKNPQAIRVSTNSRVANASNMRLVQSVDSHVRWLKNEMSAYCHGNLLLLAGAPAAFKRRYTRFSSRYLVAWEVQQIFHSIVDAYLNTFKQRIGKKTFKVQKEIRIERYRRNGKTFKRGDAKNARVVLRNSTYSGLLKYLCYCSDLSPGALANTAVGDVCSAIAREKPRRWNRIVRLVEFVQGTTLGRIKRLEYRNCAFQRHIRESGSYLFRDETNTRYQWFYRYKTGKGRSAQTVNLPMLTNPEKHDFNRIVLDGNHTVHVRGGKFRVVFTRESEQPVMKPEGKAVGGDLNCKNNLITFSNGLEVRYDEAYLGRLISQLQELDAKGEGKTRKEIQTLNKLCRRNQWYWQHLVHDILENLVADGVTDIVLEDLRQFPATFLKHRQLSIKYSRLIRLLRLSGIKIWFRSQALKRGIRVHLTQPHYTSQQCPKCGHIHQRNRKTRDLFICEECQHTDNADYNASLNLVKRWTSDVLQSSLHSKDEFGRLTPKTMNKYRTRGVLENNKTRGDFTVPFTPRVVCLKPLAAQKEALTKQCLGGVIHRQSESYCSRLPTRGSIPST